MADVANSMKADNHVWEPWKPKDGQRVRVRLSAECRFHMEPPRMTPERLAAENGQVGIVRDHDGGDCFAHKLHATHPYEVWFDPMWRDPNAPSIFEGVASAHYAAIELEPLEEEGREP